MYKPAGQFLLFIDKILQNPRIAWYPRSIEAAEWDFDSPGDSDDEDDAQETSVAQVISSRRSELSAFGAENPWLTGETRRAEWRDALLLFNNQHHHLAMLLTMLPNLRSVKLVSMHSDSEPLREMVWAIAAANRDLKSPLYGKALAKLVKIDADRDDTKYGEDITLYAPFMALPSLRLVHGHKIADEYRELPGESFGHDMELLRPRQIEEINIEYSAIGSDSWAWLLGNIENLKKFTYNHGGSMVGDADMECGKVVDLLKKHASHSLVRLDLTAGFTWTPVAWSMDGERYLDQFIGDLKAFQKLRVLRIDDWVFQKGEAGEIVRLADVLPASIRIVKLVERIEEGDLADLFRGLAEAKKSNLPELKKVILEGEYNIWKVMYDEITAAGVEISGWGLDVI